MEARAQARYVRVTPRKARRVVDLIRGLPAAQAQAVLAFAPQAASETVGKVLASAIANAETVGRLDAEALVVSRAWVDEGPTLKRFRPRAQGRAYRINKRTSHITVIISEQEAPATTPAGRRRAQAAQQDTRPAAKETAPAEDETAAAENDAAAPENVTARRPGRRRSSGGKSGDVATTDATAADTVASDEAEETGGTDQQTTPKGRTR